MRLVTLVVAMMFALGAAGASLSAQGRGNSQARKPDTKPAKTQPRVTKTETRAAKTETRATKTETRAAKATAKADARAARTTAKADARAARAETKAARNDTTGMKTNPNQEARLLAMLPPGTTIQDASQGFRNRGQFIAAVNASVNHNIPFAELKAKMTGIAPGATERTMTPMSLGQALQSFNVEPTTPLP